MKMPKTKLFDEKRLIFTCEVCGAETMTTRKLEVVAQMDKIYHISEWRICPIREKEKGCGHWQLFNYEISEEELSLREKDKKNQDVSDI